MNKVFGGPQKPLWNSRTSWYSFWKLLVRLSPDSWLTLQTHSRSDPCLTVGSSLGISPCKQSLVQPWHILGPSIFFSTCVVLCPFFLMLTMFSFSNLLGNYLCLFVKFTASLSLKACSFGKSLISPVRVRWFYIQCSCRTMSLTPLLGRTFLLSPPCPGFFFHSIVYPSYHLWCGLVSHWGWRWPEDCQCGFLVLWTQGLCPPKIHILKP